MRVYGISQVAMYRPTTYYDLMAFPEIGHPLVR